MSELLVCERCGEAFDRPETAYSANCPDCGHRHQPRTGCC